MSRGSARRASSKGSPTWTAPTPTRWTLADGLGLTLLIALTFAWTGVGDSTAITAMILTIGSLACLPFAITRLVTAGKALSQIWVPLAAALGLVIWGTISAAVSDAPWQTSVYGWFGRSDGLLTLLAVVGLLLAGSVLSRQELARTVTWLLVAGAVIVVEAMAQLAGAPYPPRSAYDGLSAGLGNPNFFAATSAILAILALGRALDSTRPTWQRWSALALAAGLTACSALSLSVQGPVALAIGVVAAGMAWSLQHRGRGRTLALSLSGAALAAGIAGVALVALQVGPFAAVREAQTIGYREAYWEAAWRMMTGLPLFGSGPDGFARYVAAFRTEDYLAAPGSQIRVSAAHDVPLQYGATFGVIGLFAWVVLMLGTGIVLIRGLLRGVDNVWLVVSIAGAWIAYLAQAMISIDAPSLKALGWTMTGLVLAAAINRETPIHRTPRPWLPWVGAGLGILGALMWLPATSTVSSAVTQSSVQGAVDDATNPALPCPVRQDMIVLLARTLPLADLASTANRALSVDPRCPALAALTGEIALQAGDLEGARKAADISVETDPLAPGSWFVLSLVLEAQGDQAGADAALAEAQRLAAIDPSDTLDQALATDPSTAPTSP